MTTALRACTTSRSFVTPFTKEYRRDHRRNGAGIQNELLPMTKGQIDLENGLVHIAESKTLNGIGDMPLTKASRDVFERQMKETSGREYPFPCPKPGARKPYMTNLRKVRGAATLKRAGCHILPRTNFDTRSLSG